jgi:Fic family protein
VNHAPGVAIPPKDRSFAFLSGLDPDLKRSLLANIRGLWTHTSTALEGNTLSLGDTLFFIREGLTIAGKSLREHHEVEGHANAVEALYDLVESGREVTAADLFSLHRAVQTSVVLDAYAPVGAWKNAPNGAYAEGADGRPAYVEYAAPECVDPLMGEWLAALNRARGDIPDRPLDRPGAARAYAGLHAAFVRIHPFADGNGRMARLLCCLPLLATGMPPLLIPKESRQEYIRLLARYELAAGPPRPGLPLFPPEEMLTPFLAFCETAWNPVWELVDQARAVQADRKALLAGD